MIQGFSGVWSVALVLTVVLLGGCGAEAPLVREVENGLGDVAACLQCPSPRAEELGNRVVTLISRIRDPSMRRLLKKKFEETVFGTRLDARDYAERNRQVGVFGDLVSVCMRGERVLGGDRYGAFALQLRYFERLRNELRATEDAEDRGGEPTPPGLRRAATSFATKLSTHLSFHSRQFERNIALCGPAELTQRQRERLAERFHAIFGRTMRTLQEIECDRLQEVAQRQGSREVARSTNGVIRLNGVPVQ